MRNQLLSRRTDRARIVLEQMEQRVLLTTVTGWAGRAYDVGSSFITPQWFESVPLTSTLAPAAEAPAEPATETIQWNGADVDVIAGQWIVQLTSEAIVGKTGPSQVTGLFTGGNVKFEVAKGLGSAGLLLVKAPDIGADAALAALLANPYVAYASPDATVGLCSTPDDTYFDSSPGPQWSLHDATNDHDIDMPEAWERLKDAEVSNTVVIAVLDNGVKYDHVDLDDNIWINTLEENGTTGVDDDGNGFEDDIRGWNFFNDGNEPYSSTGPNGNHGTMVSGIIAAETNNNQGVAGIGWNGDDQDLIEIMPITTGFSSGITEGINYVTMMKDAYLDPTKDWGANVVAINASIMTVNNLPLYNAIEAAGDENILVVAAACNFGHETHPIPSYYGVATVDLGAPGSAIWSTSLMGNGNDNYDPIGYTSAAAPHVAGVVGLLAAAVPTATAAEIKAAILGGVDILYDTDTPLVGKVLTGGRLNADRALRILMDDGPKVTSVSPAQEIYADPVDTITIDFSEDIDGDTVVGANFLLRSDGADNEFDTGDDDIWTIGDLDVSQPQNDQVEIDLGDDLDNEYYRLTIKGAGGNPISDASANPLNDGIDKVYFFEINPYTGDANEDNDTIADATASGVDTGDNDTVEGYIGDWQLGAADVDIYSFQGDAGDAFIAELNITGPFGPSLLDPALRVFNASGTELAYVRGGVDSYDSELIYRLPADGTYYVGVSSYPNDAYDPTNATSPARPATGEEGDYKLELEVYAYPPSLSEISGDAWYDSDYDGVKDGGEAALTGKTVYLDLDNDGALDPLTQDQYGTDVDLSIPFGFLTTVSSTFTISGLTGNIAEIVNITLDDLDAPAMSAMPADITLISPSATEILLTSAHTVDFSELVFDDDGDAPIWTGFGAYSSTYLPEEALYSLMGEDPNGTWTLEFYIDTFNPEAGTLDGWSITLKTGDPVAATDGSGEYAFTDLSADTYYVRQVNDWDWAETSPAAGYQSFTMTGENTQLADFGARLTADFDGDQDVDDQDIDMIAAAVRNSSTDAVYDLNGGGLDSSDHAYLIENILAPVQAEAAWGDANLDGAVDVSDLSAWLSNRMTSGHTIIGAGWSRADFNGDGAVDVSDLSIWLSHRMTEYANSAATVHLKINETPAATKTDDETANDNNATHYDGGEFVSNSGLQGNAVEFDGYNDYAMIPSNSSLKLNDEITINLWIKANDDQVTAAATTHSQGDGFTAFHDWPLDAIDEGAGFAENLDDTLLESKLEDLYDLLAEF